MSSRPPSAPHPTIPQSGPRNSRLRQIYYFMRTFDVFAALAAWARSSRPIITGMALIALMGIALETGLPYVAGPPESGWRFFRGYDFWPTWGRTLLWMLGGGLAVGGAAGLIRACLSGPRARRTAALAGLVLFGLYYHWLALFIYQPVGLTHYGRLIVDPMMTSYYTVGQQIGTGVLPPLGETLRRYPELIPTFPLHASSHPPGAVLVCYGAHRLFKTQPAFYHAAAGILTRLGLDPGWFDPAVPQTDRVAATAVGVLLALLGVLGAVPLYGLVRLALGVAPAAEATAWCAAALWIVHPALLVFEPVFDQIYATMTLGCLYCAARGLRGRPVAWGVGSGLLFMLMIFFTFTLLFVIPLLCLLAGLELARRAGCWRPAAILAQAHPAKAGGRRLWILIGAVVITCLAVELTLRAAWGIHLYGIFRAALHHHETVIAQWLNRSYRFWVFFNLYDFLFLAGGVPAVLALGALGRAAREGWRSPAALVPAWVVFPLTLLLLDLSGMTPAETARIWLFLAPGIVWGAATELVRRSGEFWRVNLALALLAQSAFYTLFHCKFKMPDF